MGHNRNGELGDRCGFCLTCGWGRRFMDGAGDDLPSTCPDCGGTIVSECGLPSARLMYQPGLSAFAGFFPFLGASLGSASCTAVSGS